MEMPLQIEVTEENAVEILERKQAGENICYRCVKDALDLVKLRIFIVPQNQE
jgi:hypothetical protein